MITELILTPDVSEIIRDAVYTILDTEQTNQKALATSAGEANPELWGLEVHRETVDVAEYIDEPPIAPLVIVRLDEMDRDTSANGADLYKFETTILVDVIAAAPAKGTDTAGLAAALKVNRGMRLVRQILCASEYARLGLRNGIVDSRKIENIKFYRPDAEYTNAVSCATLRLTVRLVESGPQTVAKILNSIVTQTNRAEDDFELFSATFGGS